MRDKVKFHNMTKPMKFRKIKMLKQYVVHWCKAQKERIKYLINNILYKLHILKRYTFNDNIFCYKDISKFFEFQVVETPNFIAVVHMRLREEHLMDYDYFYRETKHGKRRTLTLRYLDEYRTFADCHLEAIRMNVAGHWYYVDNLPVFKAMMPEEFRPVAFVDDNTPIERMEVKTIEYDIRKLKMLRNAQFLGKKEALHITNGELQYCYHKLYKDFKEYLSNLKLEDLTIGGR